MPKELSEARATITKNLKYNSFLQIMVCLASIVLMPACQDVGNQKPPDINSEILPHQSTISLDTTHEEFYRGFSEFYRGLSEFQQHFLDSINCQTYEIE